MSRSRRVDQRGELAELRDEVEEAALADYEPTGSGRYWERMVVMTTPEVEISEDGRMSYTSEGEQR